jgi:hypothetical protein
MRGSSENQDQDRNMDRNAIDDSNPNAQHSYDYYIKNAKNPYFSVADNSGYSGYIVVILIFLKINIVYVYILFHCEFHYKSCTFGLFPRCL